MRFSLLALAAAVGTAFAADSLILGFNSGSTDDQGKVKDQQAFEKEFKTAQALSGAPGNFSTIRLYTSIQGGTTDSPISAFPAAIATNTKLLLGVWASGTDNIDNELKAISSAVKQYGSKFTDLVVGLSIGSEDLYRISPVGIKNKSNPGNSPENIVKFIKQARQTLASTALKNIKVTHVDTWTTWTNSSNKVVIDNIDFIAVNAFPFYESERNNQIDNAAQLLANALHAVDGAAGGKDVWITETGWAFSGPDDFGSAKATVDNAASYWQNVGCALFGRKNVFWYTLRDANPENKVKFAISDNLSTKPRYPLECKEKKVLPTADGQSNNTDVSNSTSPSSTTPSGSGSQSASGAEATQTGAAVAAGVNGATMGLALLVAAGVWLL